MKKVIYLFFILIAYLGQIGCNSYDAGRVAVEQKMSTKEAFQYGASRGKEEERAEEVGVPVDSMSTSKAKDPSETLRKLKAMYDDGLIDEEEYKAKKKEALEAL